MVYRKKKKIFRKIRAYWIVIKIIFMFKWASYRTMYLPQRKRKKYYKNMYKKSGKMVCDAILQLQGLYIKLGQLISILATVLPPEFRNELDILQDKIPAWTWTEIKARLEEEWQNDPGEILKEISEEPLAAASIGQVHRAQLTTGEEVVIKIQYPGLEKVMQSDLKTFSGIVKWLGYFFSYPELKRVYQEIKSILLQEIDFEIEAENIKRFNDDFANVRGIKAPVIFPELTTSRVIVTEFVEGFKINDLEKYKKYQINTEQIMGKLIQSYALQIFKNGFYHADPHPGNLMVTKEGVLVFLDFGAACELSEAMQEGMVEFVQAAVKNDTEGLIKSMRKMGFIAFEADPRVYDRVVSYFNNKFQQEIGIENLNLGKIKFNLKSGMKNMADLKNMNISLRDISRTFHIPREWVLLERTFLLLMGDGTEVAPEMDIMEEFMPYLKRYSEEFGLDPSTLAVESLQQFAKNAISLPAELRKFITRMNYGELEIQLAHTGTALSLLYFLVQEVFFGAAAWLLLESSWKWDALGKTRRADFLFVGFCISGFLSMRALFKSWYTLRNK
ncbi:MAG: ABC1 kinase family protein [Myxococcota bacterium]